LIREQFGSVKPGTIYLSKYPNKSFPIYLYRRTSFSHQRGGFGEERGEKSTDVWVIDFSEESDFGRSHRIIFR